MDEIPNVTGTALDSDIEKIFGWKAKTLNTRAKASHLVQVRLILRLEAVSPSLGYNFTVGNDACVVEITPCNLIKDVVTVSVV